MNWPLMALGMAGTEQRTSREHQPPAAAVNQVCAGGWEEKEGKELNKMDLQELR